MPTNLHTTHAAETFNWVWDSGTDEWVKMTQPGGAGGGDGAILDGVSSAIKATVFDYTNSNPLAVRLTDTTGDYAAAGGGTEYTEDVAAPADPVGKALTVRRRDALVSEVTTDGDWIAANSTGKGEVYVKHVDAIPTTPPSNASTNVTQFGGTNLSTGTGAGGAGIPRVTVSNDSVVGLAAGAATIGAVDQGTVAGSNAAAWWTRLGDTTNGPVAVKAASTAAVATDPALVVRSVQLPPAIGGANTLFSLPVNIAADQLAIGLATNLEFIRGAQIVVPGATGVLPVAGNKANAVTATANPVPVGGIFQTSPTTLTDGQTATAQYTAAQNIKTDLTTVSGSALSLGQKTSALSVPVVLASDSAQPAAAAASTAVDTTDVLVRQLTELRAIRLGIQEIRDWIYGSPEVTTPIQRGARRNFPPGSTSGQDPTLFEQAEDLAETESDT